MLWSQQANQAGCTEEMWGISSVAQTWHPVALGLITTALGVERVGFSGSKAIDPQGPSHLALLTLSSYVPF